MFDGPNFWVQWYPMTWQTFFSRMRSEGSRFTWGSGGEAVFAKSCVCDRNRSQPFATVRVSAVRLSTVASVSGVVPKACQVELWRRSYIAVCRGGVSANDLWRRSCQRKFRNLTSDYTESCCWRSVNQEMWSRRCDTAEMWDMRIWRVGSARNAVFFNSFVASKARKVRS